MINVTLALYTVQLGLFMSQTRTRKLCYRKMTARCALHRSALKVFECA